MAEKRFSVFFCQLQTDADRHRHHPDRIFIMSLDKEEFGFGFLGLTLGPLVVIGGFIFEFWALFKNCK